MKYKVGDRLKRLKGSHDGMIVGDIGTIIEITDFGLKFKEFNKSGGEHSRNSDYWELITQRFIIKDDTPLSIWSLNNEMFIIASGQKDVERALISLKDGKAYHFPKPDLESQGYKYVGMFNEVFMETETYNIAEEEIPREIEITTESSHLLSGYDNYINELIKGKKK